MLLRTSVSNVTRKTTRKAVVGQEWQPPVARERQFMKIARIVAAFRPTSMSSPFLTIHA